MHRCGAARKEPEIRGEKNGTDRKRHGRWAENKEREHAAGCPGSSALSWEPHSTGPQVRNWNQCLPKGGLPPSRCPPGSSPPPGPPSRVNMRSEIFNKMAAGATSPRERTMDEGALAPTKPLAPSFGTAFQRGFGEGSALVFSKPPWLNEQHVRTTGCDTTNKYHQERRCCRVPLFNSRYHPSACQVAAFSEARAGPSERG